MLLSSVELFAGVVVCCRGRPSVRSFSLSGPAANTRLWPLPLASLPSLVLLLPSQQLQPQLPAPAQPQPQLQPALALPNSSPGSVLLARTTVELPGITKQILRRLLPYDLYSTPLLYYTITILYYTTLLSHTRALPVHTFTILSTLVAVYDTPESIGRFPFEYLSTTTLSVVGVNSARNGCRTNPSCHPTLSCCAQTHSCEI